MSDITLTSSMRANLSSLRMISGQMGKTQERLSTGLKVNSAIDNASSYYQARSLNNRAADLEALLDSMEQGIQTINAAITGLEAGTYFLEQMSSVATQTLVETPLAENMNCATLTNNVDELLAKGYTAIDASMSADDIVRILNKDGAKVVLTEDITLTTPLDISGSNIIIDGGGHKLTFNTSKGKPFVCNGDNVLLTNMNIESNGLYGNMEVGGDAAGTYTIAQFNGQNAQVQNVKITQKDYPLGDWSEAIRLNNGGRVENVDIYVRGYGGETRGIYCVGDCVVKNVGIVLDSDDFAEGVFAEDNATVAVEKIGVTRVGDKGAYGVIGIGNSKITGITPTGQMIEQNPKSLYDGKANTKAAFGQIGADALTSAAALAFYPPGVAVSDAALGAGNWYVPAIGELMEMYGFNYEEMTDGWGTSGAQGYTKDIINAALAKLGGDAEVFTNGEYNSSSEASTSEDWVLSMGDGKRMARRISGSYLRVFNEFENKFASEKKPEIGDVLYDDLSYGSADDYAAAKAAGKKAVGVVVSVSEDGKTAKAVNLKDLTFSSMDTIDNFDAANPYGGAQAKIRYQSPDKICEDIIGIENVTRTEFLGIFNEPSTVISVNDVNLDFTENATKEAHRQFSLLVEEYDKLICDSSYQGINLLKGGKQNITFNENRSNRFTIEGRDISVEALGISEFAWKTQSDISASLQQIAEALTKIRDFSAELGNNYQIIQTRQNFTGALIDVLETGSDNLTLADMNEESANYLALQTRQQLAINSLSLAAQSAQSILSLF